MKIVNLQAENIKKLVAVEITPAGDLVTISGRNGQGKTSVLDSIWWALAGASHIQAQPIRSGEKKARIRLDLGDIVVERQFNAAGSTLSVTNADGARFPSPQKMLDALLGELSFDPLAFSRMDQKKQAAELRRVAKVDLDLDQIDNLNRADYDARTTVNREAKAKRSQIEGLTVPPVQAGEPDDEAALLQEMQDAATKNSEIETRRARRATTASTIAGNRELIRRGNDRVAQLRLEAARLIAEADKAVGELLALANDTEELQKRLDEAPALPDPVNVAALSQRITAARASAGARQARDEALRRRSELEAEAKALEEKSEALTASIAAREETKASAIAAAQMPVAGLGFADGIVTFKGVPFDQCSSAEQLRVSLAIAMAANPKVRVIRIQDGSLLDDESMRAIASMAKDNDYQVWVEKVDTTGRVGVVIEDGHVKTVNPEPAELAA